MSEYIQRTPSREELLERIKVVNDLIERWTARIHSETAIYGAGWHPREPQWNAQEYWAGRFHDTKTVLEKRGRYFNVVTSRPGFRKSTYSRMAQMRR